MKAVVYLDSFDVSVQQREDPETDPAAARQGRIASAVGAEATGAYDRFDKRVDGWTKVLLHPSSAA